MSDVCRISAYLGTSGFPILDDAFSGEQEKESNNCVRMG